MLGGDTSACGDSPLNYQLPFDLYPEFSIEKTAAAKVKLLQLPLCFLLCA